MCRLPEAVLAGQLTSNQPNYPGESLSYRPACRPQRRLAGASDELLLIQRSELVGRWLWRSRWELMIVSQVVLSLELGLCQLAMKGLLCLGPERCSSTGGRTKS